MKKLTVGENIKRLRLDARLSQAALAKLSETSLLTIFRIENGKVNPIPATLKCIADALGISLDELVKGDK